MMSFRRLSVIATVATLALVAIGGLVRATESGLGCGDDWPTCSGRIIPFFSHYTEVIEFSHRAVAGIVAVLIGLLALRAFREHRERRVLVRASAAAFGLVLFQAALGAVVVKLHLDAVSVVLHLGTALLLLALLLFVALGGRVAEGSFRPTPDDRAARSAIVAAGSVFVVLLIGSYVSGRQGGYVFTDWPLMGGRIVPDLAVELEAIHFLHRALAGMVGILVIAVSVSIVKRGADLPLAARLARVAAGLYVLEVLIGAANVWTELNSAVVAAHLATGTLVWVSLVTLVLVTSPVLRAALEPATARRAEALLEGTR